MRRFCFPTGYLWEEYIDLGQQTMNTVICCWPSLSKAHWNMSHQSRSVRIKIASTTMNRSRGQAMKQGQVILKTHVSTTLYGGNIVDSSFKYFIFQANPQDLIIFNRYIDVKWASRLINSPASRLCSAFCSGWHQRKHQSSASLAFVRVIRRWPVDSPHIGLVMRKAFPCHYFVICYPDETRSSLSTYLPTDTP